MLGQIILMNTDPKQLGAELAEAFDTVIGDALHAFGITYSDPKELEGRLSKLRHQDWEPGRFTYTIDGKPFLNMTARQGHQMVTLSWVSIDKKG